MELGPKDFCRDYHQRFVARVLQGREASALVESSGKMAFAHSNDSEDRPVQLFWSDQAYARRCASGQWSDRVVKPIPLERLLEELLPAMHVEHWLVGCNWDADLFGLEVEPLTLLNELRAAWTDRTRAIVESLVPLPAPPPVATRQAAPPGPRPQSRSRVPRTTHSEFNDGVLSLPAPGRPWKGVAEPPEGVLHELRFGRGFSAPALRILKAAFPVDEADWCHQRFVQAVDFQHRSQGVGERLWRHFGLTVEGPESCSVGKLQGRCYFVGRPTFTLWFQWVFCDLVQGQRVLEFATEWQRRRGDLRELAKALEGLEPAHG